RGRERVSRNHDHHEAGERPAPAQVGVDGPLPAGAHVGRHAGEAVARQVHEPHPVPHGEEVDEPGEARCLARAGEAPVPGECVDDARLARVGSAREGHLAPRVRREIPRRCRALEEHGRPERVRTPGRRLGSLVHRLRAWKDPVRAIPRGAATKSNSPCFFGKMPPPRRTTNGLPPSPDLETMMRITGALLAIALALPAHAAGDPAAGEQKSQVCAACHGPGGQSVNPIWPHLAGQHAEYTTKQLQDFKAGKRKNEQMSPMAAPLSDQDIADLAAYFASRKAPSGTATPELVELGERLYRAGNPDTGLPA